MNRRGRTHIDDENEEVDRVEGDDEAGKPLGSLEEEVAIADLMRRREKGCTKPMKPQKAQVPRNSERAKIRIDLE